MIAGVCRKITAHPDEAAQQVAQRVQENICANAGGTKCVQHDTRLQRAVEDGGREEEPRECPAVKKRTCG